MLYHIHHIGLYSTTVRSTSEKKWRVPIEHYHNLNVMRRQRNHRKLKGEHSFCASSVSNELQVLINSIFCILI